MMIMSDKKTAFNGGLNESKDEKDAVLWIELQVYAFITTVYLPEHTDISHRAWYHGALCLGSIYHQLGKTGHPTNNLQRKETPNYNEPFERS